MTATNGRSIRLGRVGIWAAMAVSGVVGAATAGPRTVGPRTAARRPTAVAAPASSTEPKVVSKVTPAPSPRPPLDDRPAPSVDGPTLPGMPAAGRGLAAGPELPLVVPAHGRVLLFGDSMVDAGLSQRLRQWLEPRGVLLVNVAWTSATTAMWASSPRLSELLTRHRPDIVLIALGANETAIPAPEGRASAIRRIIEQVGSRPCVWIGPPLWNGETGITGVIRDHLSGCGYFDSTGLTIARGKDGIHPTLQGGAAWADQVYHRLFESKTLAER